MGLSTGDLVACVLLYADDIVLFTETKEDLQRLVSRLQSFGEESLMQVNIQKIKIMVFGRSRHQTPVQIQYDDGSLSQVQEYKYLRTIFS